MTFNYYEWNEAPSKSKAEATVKRILADLTDRRGLQNEWDAIDGDIQQQIIERWTKIVEESA